MVQEPAGRWDDDPWLTGYMPGLLEEVDHPLENRGLPAADVSSLRTMIARSIEALKSEAKLLIDAMTPPQFMLLMSLGMFKTEWWKEFYLLSFFTFP